MANPLSELDIGIIKFLRQDGRMSNRDLARALGASEVTIRKRLKSMRDRKILTVMALVEPHQLGYQHDVIISLRVDAKHLECVAEGLAKLPEVRFVAITSGAHDILFAALFKDTEDLLQFMLTKLASFEGIVSTDTTFSLRVLKRTFDWSENLA
jgi:Lrp/AsnC family transcriptional regulator, regulator for asnA, asnC and gidA